MYAISYGWSFQIYEVKFLGTLQGLQNSHSNTIIMEYLLCGMYKYLWTRQEPFLVLTDIHIFHPVTMSLKQKKNASFYKVNFIFKYYLCVNSFVSKTWWNDKDLSIHLFRTTLLTLFCGFIEIFLPSFSLTGVSI